MLKIKRWHFWLHVRNLADIPNFCNFVSMHSKNAYIYIYIHYTYMSCFKGSNSGCARQIARNLRTQAARFLGTSERCGRVLEVESARTIYKAGYAFCRRYLALSMDATRRDLIWCTCICSMHILQKDLAQVVFYRARCRYYISVCSLCRRGVDEFRLRPKLHAAGLQWCYVCTWLHIHACI